jgi:hypothetical protein
VDNLDEQIAEHQEIKRWLAGDKPPAQGRTWRRTVQAVLPAKAQAAGRTVSVLMPLSTQSLLMPCIFAGMSFSSMSFFAAPLGLLPDAGDMPGLSDLVRSLAVAVHYLSLALAIITSLGLVISFVFDGE